MSSPPLWDLLRLRKVVAVSFFKVDRAPVLWTDKETDYVFPIQDFTRRYE